MSSYLIVEKSPLLKMAYAMGMERNLFFDDDELDDKKKSLEWKGIAPSKQEREIRAVDKDFDWIPRK